MNKFQFQRLFENDLIQFAIKVLIVSVGVVFTAYLIEHFEIYWFIFDGNAYTYS